MGMNEIEPVDDRNYIKHSKFKRQSKGSLVARSDYAYGIHNKVRGLRKRRTGHRIIGDGR